MSALQKLLGLKKTIIAQVQPNSVYTVVVSPMLHILGREGDVHADTA